MRRIGAVLAVLAAGAALLVGTPDQPAVAAPPDTIDQALLLHDGHSDVYRVPFGTVAPDQRVTLRFRTAANDVDEVFLRMQDAVGKERRLPMTIAAADSRMRDRRRGSLRLLAGDVHAAEPRHVLVPLPRP